MLFQFGFTSPVSPGKFLKFAKISAKNHANTYALNQNISKCAQAIKIKFYPQI